jgi:hypothetical protein
MPVGTLTVAESSGKKSRKKLLHWAAQIKGAILATPNYGFEKRQKELAKKRKKEDKLKAKSDRKSGHFSEDGTELDDAQVTPEEPLATDAPVTQNPSA